MKKNGLLKVLSLSEMAALKAKGYTVRAHVTGDLRSKPAEYWWMMPPKGGIPVPEPEPEAPEAEEAEEAAEEVPPEPPEETGSRKKKRRSGKSGRTETDGTLQDSEGGE